MLRDDAQEVAARRPQRAAVEPPADLDRLHREDEVRVRSLERGVLLLTVAVIDPVTEVQVRRGHALLARRWYVGCLNGDAPGDSFGSVRWTDGDSFVVTTGDGRTVPVDDDPATGEPSRTVEFGVC